MPGFNQSRNTFAFTTIIIIITLRELARLLLLFSPGSVSGASIIWFSSKFSYIIWFAVDLLRGRRRRRRRVALHIWVVHVSAVREWPRVIIVRVRLVLVPIMVLMVWSRNCGCACSSGGSSSNGGALVVWVFAFCLGHHLRTVHAVVMTFDGTSIEVCLGRRRTNRIRDAV